MWGWHWKTPVRIWLGGRTKFSSWLEFQIKSDRKNRKKIEITKFSVRIADTFTCELNFRNWPISVWLIIELYFLLSQQYNMAVFIQMWLIFSHERSCKQLILILQIFSFTGITSLHLSNFHWSQIRWNFCLFRRRCWSASCGCGKRSVVSSEGYRSEKSEVQFLIASDVSKDTTNSFLGPSWYSLL